MKRRYVIPAVATIIIAIVAGGILTYRLSQPTSEEIFRNYLQQMATSKTYGLEESYSATGTTINLKGVLDTNKKSSRLAGDLVCTAKIQDKEAKINVSLQMENATLYMRLNSASGEVADRQTGNPIDVGKAYSKVLGQWYRADDEDNTAKAQLDSGVYVYGDGIIAPGYDSKKIVDSLIRNKALTFSSVTKSSYGYTIEVTSSKDAYLSSLKETFPNLNNPDLILDGIFDDQNSINFTVSTDTKGNILSEKLSSANLCIDFLEQYVANAPDNIANDVSGTSKHVSISSVSIAPITTSRLLSQLAEDIVY